MNRYLVRTVFLDGVERIDSSHETLTAALHLADGLSADLAAKGYGRSRVLVDVVDGDHPERGSLTWDDVVPAPGTAVPSHGTTTEGEA